MIPMLSPFVVVPFPKIGMSLIVPAFYGLLINQILKRTPQYVKTDKLNKWVTGTACFIAFLIMLRFGTVMQKLKGLLYLAALVYASVSDVKTRLVSDWLSIFVFLTGFINITEKELFIRLAASVFMFGFMLLCAVISKNRIGGADIKLISASTFLLGFEREIAGLIAGLFLGTVTTMILSKTKKNKQADKVTMPLIPYLSIGFMGAFFI